MPHDTGGAEVLGLGLLPPCGQPLLEHDLPHEREAGAPPRQDGEGHVLTPSRGKANNRCGACSGGAYWPRLSLVTAMMGRTYSNWSSSA